jgi:acyl-coenzyme A thioesterase PaaI-like protein
MSENDNAAKNVVQELGFTVRRGGDGLHGSAEVTPYLHAPGTSWLRASVLAMWADMLGGLLGLDALAPNAPVTVDLSVHLHRPAPEAGTVAAVGRPVKTGRSIFVAEVDFCDAAGDQFGFAACSFMRSPDGVQRPRSAPTSIDAPPYPVRLAVPLADRVDCGRGAPGRAELAVTGQTRNERGILFGGFFALVAEEAALSLTPGQALCALTIRYLSSVRTGPAVAVAVTRGGLSRVEIRDAGNAGKLAALVTTHTFGCP